MSISTWVLILTMSGYHSADPAAIDHIPGYASQNECMAAGNTWYRDQQTWAMRTDHGNATPTYNTFTCVSQIIPSVPLPAPRR